MYSSRSVLASALVLSAAAQSFVALPGGESPGRQLPACVPDAVGMDAERLKGIAPLVADGIRSGQMPGCVVLVARHGKVAYRRAFGDRQIAPERVPMTVDTLFDLASLTKPIATATSVLLLAERGCICLDAPVAEYLPDFAQNGKERVTIRQLLLHGGGLIADNPLSDYARGPEAARQKVMALTLGYPPGAKFVYSDMGFVVLGELVRTVSGEDLNAFTRQNLFAPLGMADTGFLPPEALRRRAAPTEKRDGRWLQGEVHDPRAAALGGVAGHAGLFSTASDLAVYAQMLLGRGRYGEGRVLAEETVERMTRPYPVPGGFRGLGWDLQTGYSSNRSGLYSGSAFGHGGFTGTVLWIDPELDLVFVFLSNRLHPDGQGQVNPLAAKIATVAVEAIQDRTPRRVRLGIDMLERNGFRPLQGRRVGLLTNHTGSNGAGVRTARILKQAAGVELLVLFSPEHGPTGKLDHEGIPDSRDPELGLPVFSLYGTTRRPTDAMLRGLDTLVFDIQDIGTRFYTYVSTMGYAMEAAAKRGMRFVVLDRPNPLGGLAVEGPLLDAGRESFVGFHRLPIRHGLTAGELAQLVNAERGLKLDLHVVRMQGWRRGDLFDATGLTWVNPSPNMRSLAAALLYPGIGLLETTNVSVGRGTATPFEHFGAPWIDGPHLAQSLTAAGLKGIEFHSTAFTPDASTFANQACQGVRMTLTDRRTLQPVRVGLEIARQLRTQYGSHWKAEAYDRLLINQQVHTAVLAGKPVDAIETLYRPALDEFIKCRWPYLLYVP